jgi:hypothetical protein
LNVFFRVTLGAGATKQQTYESAVDSSKFFCNVPVRDVVQMEFFTAKGRGKGSKSKKKKLAICNFNTLFLDLPPEGPFTVRIPKANLDKLCKDKKHKKVPGEFALILHFQPPSYKGSRNSSTITTMNMNHGAIANSEAPPPASVV